MADHRVGVWHRIDLPHGEYLFLAETADAERWSRTPYPVFDGIMPVTSRSKAGRYRGVIGGTGGRLGLDIETLARIASNATPDDGWLAADERSLVLAAADPVLEIACHWVLKEAYGKALGVGLALPLDRLAFAARAGAVLLNGDAGDADRPGWTFSLYRRADLVVGIARDRVVQPTPFAPAGMNPPAVPPDR